MEIVNEIQGNLGLISWEKLSQDFKDDPIAQFSIAPPVSI